MENKKQLQNGKSTSSMCDIMKDNTSQIFRKMESHIPSIVQNQSDMYSAYIHMYDDIFGTCYLSEKEFLDKIYTNHETLEQIKKSSDRFKEISLKNIETSVKLLDAYSKMQVSAVRSFDNYMHTMIQAYTDYFSKLAAAYNNPPTIRNPTNNQRS